MSHEVDTMGYVGQVPWHGLGKQVDPDASIEEWKQQSGLIWCVEEENIFYQHGQHFAHIPGYKALVRSDNRETLKVVSQRYQVVQPQDVLEFYRRIVDETPYRIETAGALRGGRQIWALARAPQEFRLKGQDLIKSYILFATSYDYSLATLAMFTSVRVVCNNTLQFSVSRDGKQAIKIPHSSKVDFTKIHQQLGLIDESTEQFEEVATKLAETTVDNEQAQDYFARVYLGKKADDPEQRFGNRVLPKLMNLYEHAPGSDLRSAHNTAWGLVNAVTRFADHERKAQSNDTRLASAWFGQGQKLKAVAVEEALKLAA